MDAPFLLDLAIPGGVRHLALPQFREQHLVHRAFPAPRTHNGLLEVRSHALRIHADLPHLAIELLTAYPAVKVDLHVCPLRSLDLASPSRPRPPALPTLVVLNLLIDSFNVCLTGAAKPRPCAGNGYDPFSRFLFLVSAAFSPAFLLFLVSAALTPASFILFDQLTFFGLSLISLIVRLEIRLMSCIL